MKKRKPIKASPQGWLRNTGTSHGQQPSRLRWSGQGWPLTCPGPLPGEPRDGDDSGIGMRTVPGMGRRMVVLGSGRRTRRRAEAARGAEVKGRPEVAEPPAGRGRGQAAPWGPQPMGAPRWCARACGCHLWEGRAKGRARRGRRRARYGGGPGGVPARSRVLLLLGGREGGSPQRRGAPDLQPRRLSLRVPGAACPLPGPTGAWGRECSRARAPGSSGKQGLCCHGAPSRRPVPRLLHRSGTRKDDLGLSNLCR